MPHRRIMGIGIALTAGLATAARAQSGGVEVTGNLTILDKGGKRATDVGQAVVWLEGAAGAVRPLRVAITTASKEFQPHLLVVPAGSTVGFPNHDPFNHNVFSLAEEATFDLGLYGRNETRTATFPKPGIVRVYCNVHGQMSAVVVVRDNPFFTQPGVDGTFRLTGVPPGRYVLRVWHERGGESTRPIDVGSEPVGGIELSLDASGFKFKPHLNKFGKRYDAEGRRY